VTIASQLRLRTLAELPPNLKTILKTMVLNTARVRPKVQL